MMSSSDKVENHLFVSTEYICDFSYPKRTVKQTGQGLQNCGGCRFIITSMKTPLPEENFVPLSSSHKSFQPNGNVSLSDTLKYRT